MAYPKGTIASCSCCSSERVGPTQKGKGGVVPFQTAQTWLSGVAAPGVEVGLLSLEGPVVTLAAGGSHLAVVWHRALPHDDGEQLLSYAIYDVPSRQRVSEGRLPLSPGTCLTWLGFSQAGPLATYDSKVWALAQL